MRRFVFINVRWLILTACFFRLSSSYAEVLVAGSTLTVNTIVGRGLLVDHFDDGLDPNLWGGVVRSFAGSPSESVTAAYDAANAFGGAGFCMRLTFNTPVNAGFGGAVFTFAPNQQTQNVSSFKFLSFFVKGSQNGLGFKIELQNASLNPDRQKSSLYINDYLDGGVTTNWQEVKIPLDAFANLDGLTNLTQIVLVFEHDYLQTSGMPTAGSVFIDNLSFGDVAQKSVRIDAFGDAWGANALGGSNGDLSGGGAIHSHSYVASPFPPAGFPLALRSQYNVTAGFAGMFFIFGGGATGFVSQTHDFSAYTQLTVQIRGNTAAETPGKIKIEIVDDLGTRTAMIPDNTVSKAAISTAWQKYSIPFTNFIGLRPAAIKQMNIIYEDTQIGANRIGVTFFDEFQFE